MKHVALSVVALAAACIALGVSIGKAVEQPRIAHEAFIAGEDNAARSGGCPLR